MTHTQGRRHGALGLSLLAIVAMVATLAVAPATQAWAVQRIVDGTTCSLTVEKCPADGQTFRLYRLATMAGDGSLTLDPQLADAVSQTGIDPTTFDEKTDATTLAKAAQSLQGYVVASSKAFGERVATASGGTARYQGLEPGMYLLCADVVTVGGSTYTALPNLVIVPRIDGWTYATDCTVDAKFEVTPVETPHNSVTKLWRGDTAQGRPASVKVRIYNGTALYREVTLSADNNWTFSWDGSGSWSVREVGVPSGYTSTVTVAKAKAGSDKTAGSAFQVTNSRGGQNPKGSPKSGTSRLPKTGDQTSLVLPAVLLCAGAALVLVGLRGRRGEGER